MKFLVTEPCLFHGEPVEPGAVLEGTIDEGAAMLHAGRGEIVPDDYVPPIPPPPEGGEGEGGATGLRDRDLIPVQDTPPCHPGQGTDPETAPDREPEEETKPHKRRHQ